MGSLKVNIEKMGKISVLNRAVLTNRSVLADFSEISISKIDSKGHNVFCEVHSLRIATSEIDEGSFFCTQFTRMSKCTL